jgi:hypothetical protein
MDSGRKVFVSAIEDREETEALLGNWDFFCRYPRTSAFPAIRPLSLEQWRLPPPKCSVQLWKNKIVNSKQKWLDLVTVAVFHWLF